ncbi:LON peptidase substrate-binding domain-containing protein [Salinisphaera hydrothermalis]|uniref:Peptidase S16 n=1 Tax=Salinisphaera hydrothermalis (strain C41B8) TaxID=1304275 RepID=A0A084IPZ6_SALHC|nr:LON peptidase substrate-binding domain-containing protein [Salinisphaera hydrothermalis]KEZ78780.1 peptidase S16 [Salinisphaera hydrothermalis C41B8]
MSYTAHALFPLSTVVFPGGILPLRIFEPRYLEMVSHCMRENEDFVVCIARPARHGDFAEPRAMGTRVSIVDFDRLPDGALGITVHGRDRVAIEDPRQTPNGLWWGDVVPVDEDSDGPCPIEFAPLKDIVAALIAEAGLHYDSSNLAYDSASWLSARLTELLPFDAATKHTLLTTDDPQERLRRIRPMIEIDNGNRQSRR